MIFNGFRLFLDDERHPKKSYKPYLSKLYGNLFSDDESYALRNWFIVRNYSEFVEFIETYGIPKYISFDNDLGEEMEGKDCVKWLIEYMMDNDIDFTPTVEFHTANPVAKKDMKCLVENYKKHRDKINEKDEKMKNFFRLSESDPQTASTVFDSLTVKERMSYLLKMKTCLGIFGQYNIKMKNVNKVLLNIQKHHLGV